VLVARLTLFFQGYVVQMPKAVVCHHTPGTKKSPPRKNTVAVAIPSALDDG